MTIEIEEELFSIWIQSVLLIPRVGRKTAWKIFKYFPDSINSSDEFALYLCKQSKTIKRFPSIDRSYVLEKINEAKAILSKSYGLANGSVINFRNFPSKLKEMDDPPLLLHFLGNCSLFHEDCVAVIGTRKPTEFGCRNAFEFGKSICKQGKVVVSGLALGCDTAAHRGALDFDGKTIAVLAHGLDSIYPAENRELAIEIITTGGLLVSEYPIGTPPRGPFFVEQQSRSLPSSKNTGKLSCSCFLKLRDAKLID